MFEEQEGTLEARGREEERRGERSWGGVYYKKGGSMCSIFWLVSS